MVRKKTKGTTLSVFKGREAKLNRAIFQTLALKGPQTVYDIHKEVTKTKGLKCTRYSSVNKRVRHLFASGFVGKFGEEKTKAGFRASRYGLVMRTYLAILLNSISLEELILHMDDARAETILAAILNTP